MYNCTVHETTGYPPFYLMFGRVPRLPVDILFKNILKDPEISNYDNYVVSLTKDLQEAMAIAQGHVNREQDRQAEFYNRRTKGKLIAVGDRVLVSNKRERGKRKIADRWESTVYTVVSINASTHTYRIRHPETGQERVVHRNLLMLVNFLPIDADSVSDGTFVSSCGKGSSDIADADESMPVAGREDAGGRTQEWVDNLTTVSADVHAERSLSEDVLSMSNGSGHTGSSQTESSSGHGFSRAFLTDSRNTRTHNAERLDDTRSTRSSSAHSDSNTLHTARSRFGRIVKPVNRLLCQMSKQGFVSNAVSRSMFRMF